MPMIRHPDIAVLGGPVPESAVDHWRTLGWEPVPDAEAELLTTVGKTRLADLSREELAAAAGRRGIDLGPKASKDRLVEALVGPSDAPAPTPAQG